MTQATTLTGANLIAGRERRDGDESFRAHNPYTGEPGTIGFAEATEREVADAAAAAAAASITYRTWSGERIGRFLRGIAAELEALGDGLLETADAETGLGLPRLDNERSRACGQLCAFADLVEDGSHVDAIIDTTGPDVRRQLIPLGPVGVFGASNFPFAFSVPGGDTAAALAAGCPVVAKAHPAHPATSELAARAILDAAEAAGAPAGVFSLLQGAGHQVGRSLVLAEPIKAVGFTGSTAVGRILFDLGAGREEPIPVFAEMGSINPLFVTPSALRARSEEVAEGFAASMTLGMGQFCTKPGLVFVPDDEDGEAFVTQVADRLHVHPGGAMLHEGIRQALMDRLERTAGVDGVEVVVRGGDADGLGTGLTPSLLVADWETFSERSELLDEHFGPVAVIVRTPPGAQLTAASRIEGNLTATIHVEDDELDDVAELAAALREKAGRLVFNGYPTGVSVTAAMHHGGPYPATTAPAHTSVGVTAIRRFQRVVAYQDAPAQLLPPALRDDNPLGIRRLIDGTWTDGPVGAA